MHKIIIFYKYTELSDPQAVMFWQKELCSRLNLTGRVLIAHEGINATLGGEIENLKLYKRAVRSYTPFKDMDFKESVGKKEDFPRLKVLVKNEIVRLGVDPRSISAKDAGIPLSPRDAHQLMSQKDDNLIILDTRNKYESAIGSFEHAVQAPIDTFKEFPDYIDNNLELFKDKKVLMYCTAGVRCERASAYLKLKQVAQEIYHIKGGIHRYVEQFPDGFFKGKNYVFDGRIAMTVSEDVLGTCFNCKQSFDEYSNCVNAECNKQIIICDACVTDYHNTCSSRCRELVQQKKVNIRVIQRKTSCSISL